MPNFVKYTNHDMSHFDRTQTRQNEPIQRLPEINLLTEYARSSINNTQKYKHASKN